MPFPILFQIGKVYPSCCLVKQVENSNVDRYSMRLLCINLPKHFYVPSFSFDIASIQCNQYISQINKTHALDVHRNV